MTVQNGPRISNFTAVGMIGVALLFDSVQGLLFFMNAIPVVGTVLDVVVSPLITVAAWCWFLLWFALHRVNYFDRNGAKKLLIMLASVVVELVPLINALPGITFGVVGLIVQTRFEDGQANALNIIGTAARAKSRLERMGKKFKPDPKTTPNPAVGSYTQSPEAANDNEPE